MGKERTIKEGLEYFPLDVDYFDDSKILMIESKFGLSGSMVATRLLCSVYRQGYYMRWSDDEALVLARKVGNGITWETVKQIVAGLIDCGFFDKRMFDDFGILTSRGIQQRWSKIISDCNRKAKIKSEFNILIQCEKSDLNGESSDLSGKKSEELQQSKVKESKVEEKKENESISDLRKLNPDMVQKAADLTEAICAYFEVKTITMSPKYNMVCEFVSSVSHRNELDIAALALKNYVAYKARSKEAKHAVKNWIGTKENHFQDGEWITTDWDLKNKNYVDSNKQHQGAPPAASSTIESGREFGNIRTYRANRGGAAKGT